jgi:L-iditol 2-dehydrogenase
MPAAANAALPPGHVHFVPQLWKARQGSPANGFTTDGGFAEYAVNHINTLARVPDTMSDAEATLVVTAGTSMYGLTELGGLVAGESVVVMAPAPSGCSLWPLQRR